MEQIYNVREELMNILSYVDFEKMCNIIKNSPGLNHNFVKEDITFPLLYSSRAIKWRKQYVNGLQIYVVQIDTITYHEFTIDKNISSET